METKDNILLQLSSLYKQFNNEHSYDDNQHILNKLSNISDNRGIISYVFNHFHVYNGVQAMHCVENIMHNSNNKVVKEYEHNVITDVKNYFGQWVELVTVHLTNGNIADTIKLVDRDLVGKMLMMTNRKYYQLKSHEVNVANAHKLIGVAKHSLLNEDKPVNHSMLAKVINGLLDKI